jgi:hypothetical protein
MDNLTRLLEKWQKRMRLGDWKIQAKLVGQDEMPDSLGQVTRDEAEKRANIAIQDNEPEIVEGTLVHELLHVWLLPWAIGDDDEPNHEAREVAINVMADVLISAYPKRKGKKRGKDGTVTTS